MRTHENWASETARIITQSRSLYTRTDGDPFFFSSGWASPVFIDCKKLISSPDDRRLLVDMALKCISAQIDLDTLDVIAGCELTGVPFATLIADRLNKPLVIVCKQSKGFGRLAQFEGGFEPGERVLLVDYLNGWCQRISVPHSPETSRGQNPKYLCAYQFQYFQT